MLSGYCSDCGGQMCICDDVDEGVEAHGTADVVEHLQSKIGDLMLEIHDLKVENDALKYSQWEPAEGIWRVSRHQYGRSSTLVAPLDVDEDEAIIRAVLHKYGDVAMRAIAEAYDRDKFCPTMLEHEDHGGACGVWPSAFEMWSKIRDAIAKDLEGA